MVLRYEVTAHPAVAPYPSHDPKYVIPIKRGGTLEYIYDVAACVKCLPDEVYRFENILPKNLYQSLIGYHECRKDSFGYGKAATEYKFYLLCDAMMIQQPFERKGIQISVWINHEDVPLY